MHGELTWRRVGGANRKGGELNWQQWQHHPEVAAIVLYGKQEARDKRKMGHFVTHASTPDEALSLAQVFRDLLRQTPPR